MDVLDNILHKILNDIIIIESNLTCSCNEMIIIMQKASMTG